MKNHESSDLLISLSRELPFVNFKVVIESTLFRFESASKTQRSKVMRGRHRPWPQAWPISCVNTFSRDISQRVEQTSLQAVAQGFGPVCWNFVTLSQWDLNWTLSHVCLISPVCLPQKVALKPHLCGMFLLLSAVLWRKLASLPPSVLKPFPIQENCSGNPAEVSGADTVLSRRKYSFCEVEEKLIISMTSNS